MALSLFAATAPAATAAGKVPDRFVGMVADGPLLTDPAVDFTAELKVMVSSGVQAIRTVFNWAGAQPYKRFADVPPDQVARFHNEHGVPTDYAATDRLVTAAARRRLAILPVVITAPGWGAAHPGQFSSRPRSPKPYANFTAALARRYGPRGSFWREHRRLVAQPIRYWQIWNEPSFIQFWSDRPYAHDYVQLLKASRNAIRRVDRQARIVLAGLPNYSWTALAKIYKAGGRGQFDVAAFHPFTRTVGGVRTILERDRQVMAQNGDRNKPLWVTELSWTSAKGRTHITYGNEQTKSGQARTLTAAYRMLARERGRLHVGRVYWYTWVTRDKDKNYPFDWAGLVRATRRGMVKKPAFRAFRSIALKLEHCRTKRSRADRCAS